MLFVKTIKLSFKNPKQRSFQKKKKKKKKIQNKESFRDKIQDWPIRPCKDNNFQYECKEGLRLKDPKNYKIQLLQKHDNC